MVPIQNMEHLKQRIRIAKKFAVTTLYLEATNGNLLHRAELCLQENGLQFEHLL